MFVFAYLLEKQLLDAFKGFSGFGVQGIIDAGTLRLKDGGIIYKRFDKGFFYNISIVMLCFFVSGFKERLLIVLAIESFFSFFITSPRPPPSPAYRLGVLYCSFLGFGKVDAGFHFWAMAGNGINYFIIVGS